MPLTDNKRQILQVARKAFERETGIRIELAWDDPDTPVLNLNPPGAKIRMKALVLPGDGLATNALLVLMTRYENPQGHIAVLQQATPDRADNLRKDGMQFIDAAGNCYINQPPLYLFIKGNKTPNVSSHQAAPRAFKQTGLRVLYTLLCNPGLENETYRNIANKTSVALGMVNWIIKDLKALNFLIEIGSGRKRQLRLIDKDRLLDRWITAYAEQLRPKLVLGRYRGAEGWWKQEVLPADEALWGGEVAAAKLTGYLKPQTVTVYVDRDNPAAVIIPNRLKKDPQGEVELVARFWKPEAIPPCEGMVHPILVFADLMATGNQRNVETARMIYDKHIVQLVR